MENCAFGKISQIPYVHYHQEVPEMPYDYVFLKLNSFEGHDFFVDLVGMNVLKGRKTRFFERKFRNVRSRKSPNKIIDILYLFVPRSEYIVEHQELLHKFARNLSQMVLFILPAFCIIFFNNDYKEYGVYWMQFGIVFDILSNITWSIIELFHWENMIFPVFAVLGITVVLAYGESEVKRQGLIRFW